MWYGDGWMFGMHFLWWILWIVLVVLLIALLVRQGTEPPSSREQSALEILERRFAAGEISSEEFEERKARLTQLRRA